MLCECNLTLYYLERQKKMHAAWLALPDIGGKGQGREKVLLRFYICRMLYSGGVTLGILGWDVPLGQWNP